MFYVDPLCNNGWRLGMNCHLWTDGSVKELQDFAESIGLKTRWMQVSKIGLVHFDLTASKRKLAIEKGAKELTRKEAVENWKMICNRKLKLRNKIVRGFFDG